MDGKRMGEIMEKSATLAKFEELTFHDNVLTGP